MSRFRGRQMWRHRIRNYVHTADKSDRWFAWKKDPPMPDDDLPVGALYPDDFPEEPVAGITDDEVEDFLTDLKPPRTDLSSVRLRNADLSRSTLRYVTLNGADLMWANLYEADLTGADLTGADLRYANLRGAGLTGAVLTGADLTDVEWDKSTVWPEGFTPSSDELTADLLSRCPTCGSTNPCWLIFRVGRGHCDDDFHDGACRCETVRKIGRTAARRELSRRTRPADLHRYDPDSAVSPGATLKEVLDDLGMSRTDLAAHTGLTTDEVDGLMEGRTSLTPDIAGRLAMAVGVPARIWNKLESSYRERAADLLDGDR